MADSKLHVARASSVMAIGTALSRITGFIRSILLVATLGTGILGDTYNVGNTMPNIIYNLLIGGSMTAVFVPQIVRAFRNKDGGKKFISALVSLISSILILITAVSMALTPFLVSLYAPTFEGRARDITIAFTLFCLPQVLFYGIYGILGQITNAHERFGPMMWAPIANNLLAISLFSFFLYKYPNISLSDISDSQVRLLGLGTTAGIVLQAIILIPFLRGNGFSLRFTWKWRGLGLRHSLKLGSWTLISLFVSQLGFLATRAGVSATSAGISYGAGYTPYANAYLILLLPHSIIAISVATAILPQLSNLVIDKDVDRIKFQIAQALRLIAIPIVPASFFFLFFGSFITQVIFPGIDSDSARYIGEVLSAFSLAAIPLAMNLVGIRTLNAFENTKLQALSNAVINLIALLISLVFYFSLPAEKVTLGLALAFTLSYWLGIWVTDRYLARYLGTQILRSQLGFYLQLSLLSLFTVGAVWSVTIWIGCEWIGIERNIATLFVVLLAAASLYLGIAKLFKIDEVGQTIRLFLRR
jgi:putative peptidoglycan lipid II flippase